MGRGGGDGLFDEEDGVDASIGGSRPSSVDCSWVELGSKFGEGVGDVFLEFEDGVGLRR